MKMKTSYIGYYPSELVVSHFIRLDRIYVCICTRIYTCIYLRICLPFKIVYACEHCKILIAGNATCMHASTSQIVPVHIM